MQIDRRVSATPRYSDIKILNSIYAPSKLKSEFTSMITYRSRNSFKFWILVFKSIFNLFAECGSMSLRMLSRVRWGKGSTGFLIFSFTLLWMALLSSEVNFNSWWNFISGFWQILKGLVSDYEIPWRNIYADWQVGSFPMLVHFSLLSTLGFVQILIPKTSKNWRDEKNPEQKGTSFLYFALKKHVKLDARYYNSFVDPAIWILYTILIYEMIPNGIYKYFLIWASISLCYQEIRDYLAQKKVEENI